MKKSLKYIFIALLAIIVVSCEKDDEIVDLEQLAAPSNLGASFKITQDNSGLVTIAPVGESANQFTVDFGDGSPVSDVLTPGQKVDHVYAEGDYEVVVTGKNLNGKTAQGTQNLTVSFRAPENLEVDLVQSANNPKKITVSATADYATMFNVYFGEMADEEPIALMPGETLEYTYSAPGDYDVRVVALSGGVATTEETITVTVPEANPPKLPITFDEANTNYNIGVFGGASFEVVTNPHPEGINADETNVGALTNAGNNYEGGAFNLGEPVDFSGDNKTISLKMYSEVAVPVLLKFEGGVNGERQTEVTANHTGSGWEELTFNFATDAIKSYIDGTQGAGEPFVPTGQYGTMVIFIDGPGTTAGTFYLDDIKMAAAIPDAPLTAAPTPTIDEANVISLFSDSYTNVPVDTWRTDWSVANLEDITIDGNATKKYTNLNYVGIETVGSQIDATGMTHFHTDIWTNNATTVRVKLVDFGADGGYQGGDDSEHEIVIDNPTQGEWVSLDLPLSDFENLTGRAHISQLIYSAITAGEATLYVDNVYFYNADAAGASTFGVPVTFDDLDSYDVTPFGAEGTSFEVVANPFESGSNNETTMVGKITKTGAAYEGVTLNLEEPVDFSSGSKVFSINVYSETAFQVLMKFETGVNGERANEVEISHGGTGWEKLTFDFNNARKSYVDGDAENGQPFVPSGQYNKISIFLDFGGGASGTYYIDDILRN